MIQGKTCQDKTKKHEKTQLTKYRLELPLFIPSSGWSFFVDLIQHW